MSAERLVHYPLRIAPSALAVSRAIASAAKADGHLLLVDQCTCSSVLRQAILLGLRQLAAPLHVDVSLLDG